MLYKFTRIISKYGWDPEAKESRRFEIDDNYDPMTWDDLINNIGYLVEGHKDETINIKIKTVKEDE